MFSNNKEPTGYDSNNPDEWKSGNNASVTIDHSVNAPKDTPIVFTSLKNTRRWGSTREDPSVHISVHDPTLRP